jgi:hypothetical protein
MHALTLFNTQIRQLDGLFSLNDLHAASGNGLKHKPANFMRLDSTTDLIEEIRCSDLSITPARTIKGNRADGIPQGTYVCRELVYAYAMWISAKFHLHVIRAFDALQQPSFQFTPPIDDLVEELTNQVLARDIGTIRRRIVDIITTRLYQKPHEDIRAWALGDPTHLGITLVTLEDLDSFYFACEIIRKNITRLMDPTQPFLVTYHQKTAQ